MVYISLDLVLELVESGLPEVIDLLYKQIERRISVEVAPHRLSIGRVTTPFKPLFCTIVEHRQSSSCQVVQNIVLHQMCLGVVGMYSRLVMVITEGAQHIRVRECLLYLLVESVQRVERMLVDESVYQLEIERIVEHTLYIMLIVPYILHPIV